MKRLLFLLLLGCPGDTPTDTDEPGYTSILLDASAETGVLLGAWSNGTEALLVGGDFAGIGRITRFDGERFCVEAEELPGVLWWVHGRSPTDWYAVGEDGIVVHEVNGTRTREDLPTDVTLFGVFDDGTDVWAVGGDVRNTQRGEIWRKPAGGTWELVQGDIPGLMFKVWNNWFVGDGIAKFWDGTTFVDRNPPMGAKLLTITGSGSNIWAVGGTNRPVLLKWAEGAWVPTDVAVACAGNQGLNGIFVEGSDVYTAGHNGAASHFDGAEWSCDIPPLTQAHFHAVWKFGDELLWTGGDLFSSSDNHGTVAVFPPRSGPPLTVSTCP